MPISNIPHRTSLQRPTSSIPALFRGAYVVVVLGLTTLAVIQILAS